MGVFLLDLIIYMNQKCKVYEELKAQAIYRIKTVSHQSNNEVFHGPL